MKDFKPRRYQQQLMNDITNLKSDAIRYGRPLAGTHRVMGVDLGEPGGDHTVITHAKMNGRGEIVKVWIDEYATWPVYKWYRNPIKWFRLRKLFKNIGIS